MRTTRYRPDRCYILIRAVLIAMLASALPSLPATAEGDWPQWRGPRADGSVAVSSRRTPLPEQLDTLWRQRIGSGYSGPVVEGDRVWVHSRQGEEEWVSCIDLDSAEPIWRRSYAAPFRQDTSARSHGRGPYATPAIREGRLFTFGVRSVLIAWSAEDGAQLWRRDSADEFEPSFPFFGAAASPVVWRDLVYIHLGGHDRDHYDLSTPGAMVALAVADGQEVWRWSGDAPALAATPVIAEIEGQSQLVFKTKRMIVGADARTGHELWRMPYRVSQDNTIVTPLFVGEQLIISDFDWGVAAWAVQRPAGEWRLRPLWRHRAVSMFVSSPVVAGGRLVGFSHLVGGRLFALEPMSGKVTWQGRRRSGEHATLVSRGREVLVFTDDGRLVVFEVTDRRLRELGNYRLGRSVGWCHPAVLGHRIVYRDGEDLVAASLGR